MPTPFVLLFIQSNVQRKTDYISDTGKPRIPRKDINRIRINEEGVEGGILENVTLARP
eukprot:COSAG02_NODE_11_length_58539_cov_103.119473_6_plen_58_part_00